jgi:DNA-binding CsgD family transcriptional regulator
MRVGNSRTARFVGDLGARTLPAAVDRTSPGQINWFHSATMEAGWPYIPRLSDVCALVSALTNLGTAELRTDDVDGRVKLERSLALAQRYGLDEQAVRAFCNLAHWALGTRRLALANNYLDRALEYCSEPELDGLRLHLLGCRARLELDLGNWSRSTDVSATVLRNPQCPPVARARALTALGLIRARRGDPDSSGPLDEALAIAQCTGEFQRTAAIAAARAEAAWLVGDYKKVADETRTVLELARRRQTRWIVGELAYWRYQAGLRDDLARRELAKPYGLATAGNWDAAGHEWRAIGCPYESALAFADGDQPACETAIERLRHLGARRTAATVIERMRERRTAAARPGPRPRTLANPAGLTPRELDVLSLLPSGLRNAEIAQRLVVSEKTVDHHVSAVLRKLGVRNRREASVEAARLGIGQPQLEHTALTL